MSLNKVVHALRKHKSFIITSHINMEGDSLGSLIGLYYLLKGLGKKVVIVCDERPPKAYAFLAEPVKIYTHLKKLDFDVAVVLDSPSIARIGAVSKLISKEKLVVNIDHHISNENFGDINWVEPAVSSVGEMIYLLFKKMRVKIPKPAALRLYAAIITDTGSFRHSNSTPRAHRIVSELIELGINPARVSERLYESNTISEMRLLGMALSTLNRTKDGRIAWLRVTRDMMQKAGSTAGETEGFVDFAKSIEGAEVGIFFRETEKKNLTKVSFRSRGGVDANAIASFFGGGGHRAASGCEIKANIDKAERLVLAKVKEVVKGGK